MPRSPFLLALVFLFTSLTLSAQVKKGFKLLEKQEYDKAYTCFQKDLNTPENGIPAAYGCLKAATGMTETSRWLEAIAGYEKARDDFNAADDKAKKKLNADFKLNPNALDQAYNGLFSKALVFVEKQKTATPLRDSFMNTVTVIPKTYKTRYNKLMIQQKTEPVVTRTKIDLSKKSTQTAVAVDRLPSPGSSLQFVKGFNSSGSEYIPVLSADGKLMYFVGSNRTDNYAYEDVFYTERLEDGSWSAPKLDEFLSGPQNEAVVSLSSDGNSMVLFIEGKPHLAKRTDSGWSDPVPIVLGQSYSWIGMASITRNGEALLFEAKELTYSDINIYVALRKKTGGWDMPFSVGKTINTDGHERTPFLHSDFKTLYFSSNGRLGEGGFDVYKSTRLDDTWKNWSTPQSLGPKVNTNRDEYGFCIPPSGTVAYLATEISGYNDQDIVRIPLDSAAQPEVQVIVKGTLTDSKGKGLRGELIVEDAVSQKITQTVITQPDGQYAFSIPKTAKVYYYAKGDSLVSTKRTYIDASTYKSDAVVEKTEVVSYNEVVSENKPIELKDLFFDFAKYDLSAAAQTELKRVYDSLKSFGWNIEIGGHTDNVGSEASNQVLSERRAQAVRDFLVAQGYPAAKISYKGYGQTVPLASNETETGRASNRRVEVRVKK